MPAILVLVLLPGCGGGGASPSTPESGSKASFSAAPDPAGVGVPVQFTDTSTGAVSTWAWSFGDGGTSSLRNPTHTYLASGQYTVSLTAGGAGGSATLTRVLNVGAGPDTGPFHGTLLLGSPTDTSVKVNVFSPDQSGTFTLQWGTLTGTYDHQTAVVDLMAGKPTTLTLTGLPPNTRIYYRLVYQPTTGTGAGPTPESTFHTARPSGSTFSFTVQADSHMDENSDLAVYQRTLGNVRTDLPDFHVDLGDTFMCEKHTGPLDPVVRMAPDQPTVLARYAYERGNFGLASHSAPLFLVNGNHEGEAGWLRNGTAQNVAIWATQARQAYFANPTPDAFYSGDPVEEAFVGKRASWYAWRWGDAHFFVLDPFWAATQSGTDGWGLTLGARQYQWLQQTLASSTATFKFVFIHNLVGGLVLLGNWRGGIEGAPYGEWGGKNYDGTDGFAAHRPGWSMPIHQLLVKYGVTAVFHGHDHLYAKQTLDGIVYQEVPQPSAANSQSGPTLAADYHYLSGTILSSSGHLRVTVRPSGVTCEYVRAWTPAQERGAQVNGHVDDTWTISAPVPRRTR